MNSYAYYLIIRETTENQRHPSLHLQDLVTFLTNVTNAALLNLPESIKSLIYFDALEHLSRSMKVCTKCFFYQAARNNEQLLFRT